MLCFMEKIFQVQPFEGVKAYVVVCNHADGYGDPNRAEFTGPQAGKNADDYAAFMNSRINGTPAPSLDPWIPMLEELVWYFDPNNRTDAVRRQYQIVDVHQEKGRDGYQLVLDRPKQSEEDFTIRRVSSEYCAPV